MAWATMIMVTLPVERVFLFSKQNILLEHAPWITLRKRGGIALYQFRLVSGF